MALLKPKKQEETARLNIKLLASTHQEIQDYIAWAGLDNQDDFFEQAAQMVFRKDRDWKSHKKAEKQAATSKPGETA